MKKPRGKKVSHKRRVELIMEAQALRNDLRILQERLIYAEMMIRKDYWTVEDLKWLPRFKARLKD